MSAASIVVPVIAKIRLLLQRRAQPLEPRLRLIVVLVATVMVAAMAIWAWSSADLAVEDLTVGPLLAALLIAAPLSLALKAAEFGVAARISGQRPSRRRTAHVAAVAAIANLLPLPGSLLVTVRSLSEDGATYKEAITAGAIPGLAWLSITGAVGGGAIAVSGSPVLGVLVTVGGLATGAVTYAMFRSAAPADGRAGLIAAVVAVEFGWLAVSALRLWLAVEALGSSISIGQALGLSVAGAVTVAVGFFPGGLGLRELLIAGLSPLIGIPLNVGVLMATIDRLVWMVFLVAVAAWLSATNRRQRTR